MVNKNNSINLYRGRGITFFDKFIKWVLTFGRLIIILTEFIALCAFLYRFTLDRRLIDLKDKIEQKQLIVKSLNKNEIKFTNLQERLSSISSLENNGMATIKVVKDIVALTPKDIIYNNFVLNNERLRIDATVLSVSSLSNFIKALRNYPKIKTVSLDKIENKTSNAVIKVSVVATLNK